MNLSTDMAVAFSKKFFKLMVQPCDQSQIGVSLWGLKEIEAYNKSGARNSTANKVQGDIDSIGFINQLP